jgi:hypothetical protein
MKRTYLAILLLSSFAVAASSTATQVISGNMVQTVGMVVTDNQGGGDTYRAWDGSDYPSVAGSYIFDPTQAQVSAGSGGNYYTVHVGVAVEINSTIHGRLTATGGSEYRVNGSPLPFVIADKAADKQNLSFDASIFVPTGQKVPNLADITLTMETTP